MSYEASPSTIERLWWHAGFGGDSERAGSIANATWVPQGADLDVERLNSALTDLLAMLQNLNAYAAREEEFYQKTGRLK